MPFASSLARTMAIARVKNLRGLQQPAAARGRDAMATVTSRLQTLNLAVDVTVRVAEDEGLQESQPHGKNKQPKDEQEEEPKKTEGYMEEPAKSSLDRGKATTVGNGPWDQLGFSQPPRGAVMRGSWTMSKKAGCFANMGRRAERVPFTRCIIRARLLLRRR